ncbi:hypothetical protein [Barnesiella sp. An55]|uniref:hypothetical protein n=1 Tax=Barnesiella sp. An55 TaxID=1965646 RepID=UPI000B36AA90|nr:hypothetical protein [Barnesiella sp. An55]OUN73026.1 hypothetical protein B5G10_06050 [Barnesiella sp. An55]HIZ26085.1 hypothetical protein [Candidatus Barnesiella merdipullorum]
MKPAAWLLICAGFILSASSITDEECRYESKPPYRSFILEGYSEPSARHYFDTAPIDNWEGIWLMTENGMRVSIERFKDVRFSEIFTHRIVKLDTIVQSETPVGTVVGYLSRGVAANTCFVWLYKHKLTGSILFKPERFSARLTTDLNGIIFSGNRAKNLEDLFDPRSGFVKIYPKQISDETENRDIRYL